MESRTRSGVIQIIGATAVAGVAGYLVTFSVFRVTGPVLYAGFAVFWAALYLIIGALSGVQQEITRATAPIMADREHVSRSRTFGLAAAVVVLAVVLGSSPLWSDAVFGSVNRALVFPLAVGVTCYVGVAVVCGSLYGVRQWRLLAAMIGADGVLRLLLVLVALAFSRDLLVLAWVVSLPFALVPLILWRFLRRGLVGRIQLDVGYRALAWNVARTVAASVSSAVLVSGFPLLVTVASAGQTRALVGVAIFAITLARAPLIVTVMSLQSYFVVRFRDAGAHWRRDALVIGAIIAAAGVVFSGIAYVIGVPVLVVVSGHAVPLGGWFIAVLVLSSACIALLTVTGSIVLAQARHLAYSIGWLCAALGTIVVMCLPLPFLFRIELAMLVGPVVGLIVHVIALALRAASTPAGPSVVRLSGA